MNNLKKFFVTGLVILLPLTLTLVIVAFIFNLLTDPFVGMVSGILKHFDLLEGGFWIFSGQELQRYGSQILILVALFLFTAFLGYVARWVFFHYFFRFGEKILNRIPFISTIYKTSQDVINTIFTSQTNSFKQVVMVHFPSKESYTIGLITRESIPQLEKEESYVAVFVPTTPNPTSGFLLMAKQKDLIYLDMKIEEALKYVISCGVIFPNFRQLSEKEVQALKKTPIQELSPLEAASLPSLSEETL